MASSCPSAPGVVGGRAWQAKVAESVEAVVTRVADDLGLYLHQGQYDYHVRAVRGRWSKYRLRRSETAGDVLASFAEQSLVSRMDRLPCDYQQILDELGVLGTNDAVAALHLAHAVAEISGATGETYVKLLETVWVSLRPGTNS
jgi:hypothetical protein